MGRGCKALQETLLVHAAALKKSFHRHSLIGALGFLFLFLQNVFFYLFAFLTMALLRYGSYIIYLFEVYKSVIFGVLHY